MKHLGEKEKTYNASFRLTFVLAILGATALVASDPVTVAFAFICTAASLFAACRRLYSIAKARDCGPVEAHRWSTIVARKHGYFRGRIQSRRDVVLLLLAMMVSLVIANVLCN